MPELGETRLAEEIGKKPLKARYVWAACEKCGQPRWVSFVLSKREPKSDICFSCARRVQKGAKGGSCMDKDGYRIVSLPWNHPRIKMANKRGWILEHRLVMAESLDRDLEEYESIHHLNGDKKDNRIENLKLMGKADHLQRHLGLPYIQRIQDLERLVKCQEARTKILESEVQTLRGL